MEKNFNCPITRQNFYRPVLANDRQIYEEEALYLACARCGPISPYSRVALNFKFIPQPWTFPDDDVYTPKWSISICEWRNHLHYGCITIPIDEWWNIAHSITRRYTPWLEDIIKHWETLWNASTTPAMQMECVWFAARCAPEKLWWTLTRCSDNLFTYHEKAHGWTVLTIIRRYAMCPPMLAYCVSKGANPQACSHHGRRAMDHLPQLQAQWPSSLSQSAYG